MPDPGTGDEELSAEQAHSSAALESIFLATAWNRPWDSPPATITAQQPSTSTYVAGAELDSVGIDDRKTSALFDILKYLTSDGETPATDTDEAMADQQLDAGQDVCYELTIPWFPSESDDAQASPNVLATGAELFDANSSINDVLRQCANPMEPDYQMERAASTNVQDLTRRLHGGQPVDERAPAPTIAVRAPLTRRRNLKGLTHDERKKLHRDENRVKEAQRRRRKKAELESLKQRVESLEAANRALTAHIARLTQKQEYPETPSMELKVPGPSTFALQTNAFARAFQPYGKATDAASARFTTPSPGTFYQPMKKPAGTPLHERVPTQYRRQETTKCIAELSAERPALKAAYGAPVVVPRTPTDRYYTKKYD